MKTQQQKNLIKDINIANPNLITTTDEDNINNEENLPANNNKATPISQKENIVKTGAMPKDMQSIINQIVAEKKVQFERKSSTGGNTASHPKPSVRTLYGCQKEYPMW